MKEFILTQSYSNLNEMLTSGEVAVYKEELQQGTIKQYAIVSRIGNRYDLNGKKIDGYVVNPYTTENQVFDAEEDVCAEIEEKILEEVSMKYVEVEQFIDNAIAKAVEETKTVYESQLVELKENHEKEIAEIKAKAIASAKAELLAKLNS